MSSHMLVCESLRPLQTGGIGMESLQSPMFPTLVCSKSIPNTNAVPNVPDWLIKCLQRSKYRLVVSILQIAAGT